LCECDERVAAHGDQCTDHYGGGGGADYFVCCAHVDSMHGNRTFSNRISILVFGAV
jgi:hypothetical protein